MAANPRNSYGTRTAMLRLAGCIGSAFRAMLREGRTRRQLSTVDFFMARDANRFSIVNGKAEVGKFRPRFNMMGLHLSAFSTDRAFMTVSLKNLASPRGDLGLIDFPFGGGRSALPVKMPLAGTGGASAFLTAIFLSLITGKKGLAAKQTGATLKRAADIPTFTGAIFSIGTVLPCLKSFAAYYARPVYAMPSVFTPDRIKAFCGAINLRSKPRLIILSADRAHGGRDFLDSKVMPPDEKWRVKLASFAFGYYGRSATALTYIHGQTIAFYLIFVKYCFVIYQRMSSTIPGIKRRMTDAFPGIEIKKVK